MMIQTDMNTHTYKHPDINKSIHTQVLTHTHTNARTHTYTFTHTHTLTLTLTLTHATAHAYITSEKAHEGQSKPVASTM